ncbi:MAG: radical SAM/SPASM domain-containing protein [Cellulosilyticaceae bacterium]
MKRFKKVYIEISNRCNLSCSFCPKLARTPGRMTYEQFEKVLGEVKPYTDYIYLHLMGEPTAHPELEAFLELAKASQLRVNLTTNGTLLHRVKDLLLQEGRVRQINISLHSFEANENGITLEGYIREIIAFAKEASAKGVICSLRLWNKDQAELRGDNALNGYILKTLEEGFDVATSLEEALAQKPSFKLMNRVYLNMAERFEWPDLSRDVISTEAFCYGLRDQMGILVDGTVVPCCLDSEGSIELGNVFDTPLQQILESPRAQALYEGFSNRQAVEALCQRCGYVTRYKK